MLTALRFILIGSSLAMGGIAIWGMYFIGNRATILGNGGEEWQPAYSPGYTTISFLIPVLALFVAFIVIGSSDGAIDFIRVILAGAITGLGVCAMHYLGQAGIANYDCLYNVPHVISSVGIAIVASIIALGVFSHFRASWDTRWWWRVICAVNLAIAVSGTHWVVSVGTAYHHSHTDMREVSTFSRNNNSIGVIVLVSSVQQIMVYLLINNSLSQAASSSCSLLYLVNSISHFSGTKINK